MGIVDRPGRIVEGEIQFRRRGTEGGGGADHVVDLAKLAPDGQEMRAIRGAEIALIFQEPMSSFSPVHTIGNQISEPSAGASDSASASRARSPCTRAWWSPMSPSRPWTCRCRPRS